MTSCYIWGTTAAIRAAGDGDVVTSARAGGSYKVTRSVVPQLHELSDKRKRSLTDYIVEQNRFGVTPTLSTMNLKEHVERRQPTVEARTTLLLRHLRSAGPLGTVTTFIVPLDPKTAEASHSLLAGTSSLQLAEVVTLAEHCSNEGWITHRASEKPSGARFLHELLLRPPGYKYLDQIDGVARQSEQAFVAMWFDASMNQAAADGFEAGIRDAGYTPMRIDRKEHADKIDDQIIAEIRRSRFVVADFTSEPDKPRGGVYFEAGFARGLGIPVIWTCRKDLIGQVHFDTRQFNHVVWETPADLRSKLATRISAVVGDGPHRGS